MVLLGFEELRDGGSDFRRLKVAVDVVRMRGREWILDDDVRCPAKLSEIRRDLVHNGDDIILIGEI